MIRFTRRLTPIVLALGMILAPAATPMARAQEPAGPEGESKGDPVPGYLGLGLLAMVVMFAVGKSARRS
jgi:hypothetical protein